MSVDRIVRRRSKKGIAKRFLLSEGERKGREKLEKLNCNDPVTFAREVLAFEPFEYQAKILTDNSKRILVCAGRQVGKSMCIAAKAIHFALCNKSTVTLIVSVTERQSTLMFEKIVSLLGSKLPGLIKEMNKTRIVLSNGSKIIAVPSGRYGNTIRGFTIDLAIIDEAAFVPEGVITEAVFPILSTTDGLCWMLSTPYDKDHFFYRAFNKTNWSVYHLPSSANPKISKEFLDEQRDTVGELRFQREYEAQFVDDVNSYFPMSLIRPCIDPELSEVYEAKSYDDPVYAGYDPGGKADPAALAAVTKSKDGYSVRYAKTWLRQDYVTTDFEVVDTCRKLNAEKLTFDQTGLGNPLLSHLCEIYETERVDGVTLSSKTREEILLNLRLQFEQRLIKLPNDRELLASLNCITYERTHSGGFNFKHRNGTHDDLAYALALAAWAAKHSEEGIVIII